MLSIDLHTDTLLRITADVHKVSAKVKGEAPRFEKDAEKFGANAGAKVDSAVSSYANAAAARRSSSRRSSSSPLVALMEDPTTPTPTTPTHPVDMHFSTSDSPFKNTWLMIS